MKLGLFRLQNLYLLLLEFRLLLEVYRQKYFRMFKLSYVCFYSHLQLINKKAESYCYVRMYFSNKLFFLYFEIIKLKLKTSSYSTVYLK